MVPLYFQGQNSTQEKTWHFDQLNEINLIRVGEVTQQVKVPALSITTWVPSPGPTWWDEEIYFQKLSFDSHLHSSETQYPNLLHCMWSSDTDSYSFWKIECYWILIMGQLKHIPQRKKKTTNRLFKKFEYHESKLNIMKAN